MADKRDKYKYNNFNNLMCVVDLDEIKRSDRWVSYSVTRWLDYVSFYGNLQQWKLGPIA